MSTLVSTISSAVQSLVAKTGHGVESCTTMAEAKPFEVTLAQRAPTKDSKEVYYGACACEAVHMEVSDEQQQAVREAAELSCRSD